MAGRAYGAPERAGTHAAGVRAARPDGPAGHPGRFSGSACADPVPGRTGTSGWMGEVVHGAVCLLAAAPGRRYCASREEPVVRQSRRCSRSGCAQPAAATLTYVYAESTAVVGPLATFSEPHSYDLCEFHAERLTVPRGWEVVRHEIDVEDSGPTGDDLLALADAVREAARPEPPRAATVPRVRNRW